MQYDCGWRRTIFDKAPFALKAIMATAYGAIQRSNRFNKSTREMADFLSELGMLRGDAIERYQLRELRRFLTEAGRESSYYRLLFRNSHFDPGALESTDQLAALPILTKEQVRQNISDILPRNLSAQDCEWRHTSGTTGKALQFPESRDCAQREFAFRIEHYRWAGVDLFARPRVAYAAGHPVTPAERKAPPFWVCDYANRYLFLSSYHFTEENMTAYVERLESYLPEVVAGYPSSLCLLAQAILRSGRKLNPRAVFASSETLSEGQRKVIEEAFGCKVFSFYGNTECCGIALECEYGLHHGRLDHSLMEVVDENGHACTRGRLICTGFGNSAFPLVRYDTGDIVTLAQNQRCECGRQGLLLMGIEGRSEEYICTPDGRRVGRLDHLFKDAVNVLEAQLEQQHCDELIVRIVRRPEFRAADQEAIAREARIRLGSEISLRFEYVDALQRTANGKLRFVVSNVKQPEILEPI
ncbi:MAG: hypothetical protein ABR907_09260 [Terracidiphilus sp.]|jgi:phenylacetate-CoA ligase